MKKGYVNLKIVKLAALAIIFILISSSCFAAARCPPSLDKEVSDQLTEEQLKALQEERDLSDLDAHLLSLGAYRELITEPKTSSQLQAGRATKADIATYSDRIIAVLNKKDPQEVKKVLNEAAWIYSSLGPAEIPGELSKRDAARIVKAEALMKDLEESVADETRDEDKGTKAVKAIVNLARETKNRYIHHKTISALVKAYPKAEWSDTDPEDLQGMMITKGFKLEISEEIENLGSIFDEYFREQVSKDPEGSTDLMNFAFDTRKEDLIFTHPELGTKIVPALIKIELHEAVGYNAVQGRTATRRLAEIARETKDKGIQNRIVKELMDIYPESEWLEPDFYDPNAYPIQAGFQPTVKAQLENLGPIFADYVTAEIPKDPEASINLMSFVIDINKDIIATHPELNSKIVPALLRNIDNIYAFTVLFNTEEALPLVIEELLVTKDGDKIESLARIIARTASVEQVLELIEKNPENGMPVFAKLYGNKIENNLDTIVRALFASKNRELWDESTRIIKEKLGEPALDTLVTYLQIEELRAGIDSAIKMFPKEEVLKKIGYPPQYDLSKIKVEADRIRIIAPEKEFTGYFSVEDGQTFVIFSDEKDPNSIIVRVPFTENYDVLMRKFNEQRYLIEQGKISLVNDVTELNYLGPEDAATGVEVGRGALKYRLFFLEGGEIDAFKLVGNKFTRVFGKEVRDTVENLYHRFLELQSKGIFEKIGVHRQAWKKVLLLRYGTLEYKKKSIFTRLWRGLAQAGKEFSDELEKLRPAISGGPAAITDWEEAYGRRLRTITEDEVEELDEIIREDEYLNFLVEKYGIAEEESHRLYLVNLVYNREISSAAGLYRSQKKTVYMNLEGIIGRGLKYYKGTLTHEIIHHVWHFLPIKKKIAITRYVHENLEHLTKELRKSDFYRFNSPKQIANEALAYVLENALVRNSKEAFGDTEVSIDDIRFMMEQVELPQEFIDRKIREIEGVPEEASPEMQQLIEEVESEIC